MSIRRGLPEHEGRMFALAVFMLSGAVFLYQVVLTRLFAIAHFYHFAFIIVALALLGGGASGSFLTVWPQLLRAPSRRSVSLTCAATELSILLSYLLINRLPFDAYAVAIDPLQFLILGMQFIALAMPFLCTGLLVSGLMRDFPQRSHIIYACNLSGSAAGCLLAPVALSLAGGEGAALLSTAGAGLAALVALLPSAVKKPIRVAPSLLSAVVLGLLCLGLILVPLHEALRRARGEAGNPIFDAYLSPYKPLSYALQYPGARVSATRWNAFSRVDIVQSGGIRSLPGLSFLYPGLVEARAGIFIDGGDLAALLPPNPQADYFAYLPQALAFRLRPAADALILEARAGADILTALAGNAAHVTAVESNPLLVKAAVSIYALPDVCAVSESPRAFLARDRATYDVILLPITSSYTPVTSGAYGLVEDYHYTREAIQAAYAHLKPGGLLVISRWLQTPPSEFLRAFILTVESLEDLGLDAGARIAALRGYNLGTLFISRDPYSIEELAAIRAFASERTFDLVYLPGLRPEEANRFNILPDDAYYRHFNAYLTSPHRTAWLHSYPYDVSAPSDDHPFFTHFFKWSQISDILAQYGRTWQPFGGAGFLVVVFLLLFMLALSALLIILPLVLRRAGQPHFISAQPATRTAALALFALIGVGFMAVEIPLIQKFILYLGQPSFAFSVVVAALLFFSGLGSLASPRVPRHSMLALAMLVLLSPVWLGAVFQATLRWPFALRLLTAFACLAPLGFLMGTPLSKGMAELSRAEDYNRLMPWAWAVNGTASVISSVLAAMLALTFNFTTVLRGGCACYLLAWFTLGILSRH